MRTIAGINLPDSRLAREAEELAQEHSPAFLLAHCQRTFVFGSLAAQAAGLKVQEELAYIAALLHDLGLTSAYAGERRFEVDGAEAAREWAIGAGMSAAETRGLWDAIALHTSVGIADLQSPESAVVYWGAGLDVMGFGLEHLPPPVRDAVNEALPRDGFARDFAQLVEDAARRSPDAYGQTWLAPTAARFCGGGIPTSEDMLGRDPFAA